MAPRTGLVSARSASRTTAWYQSAKFASRVAFSPRSIAVVKQNSPAVASPGDRGVTKSTLSLTAASCHHADTAATRGTTRAADRTAFSDHPDSAPRLEAGDGQRG